MLIPDAVLRVRRPSRVTVCVLLLAGVAFLLSMATAFCSRALGPADEFAHVDHAYQLWHGHLVSPHYPQLSALGPLFGHHEGQHTGQHPPLFYLLAAPLVGPLMDHHHALAAVYAARTISALSAAGLVLAIVLLARVVAPGRPRLWLVAGLVTAVHPTVARVGGAYLNDNLAAMLGVLVLAAVCAVLRNGPSVRGLLWIGLTCALALYTRAAVVFVIAGAVGVLGLWLLIRRRPAWRWIAGLCGVMALAVGSVAWFYVRNVHVTGNLTGGSYDLASGAHYQDRSISAVAVDPRVWRGFFGNLAGGIWPWTWSAWGLLAIPMIIAAVLVGWRIKSVPQRAWLVSAVVLGGVLVLIGQLDYTAKGGDANFRYVEPLIPITSLAIAYVITWRNRLTIPLSLAWTLAAFAPFIPRMAQRLASPAGAGAAPVFPGLAMASIAAAVVGLTIAFVLLRDRQVPTIDASPVEPLPEPSAA